MFVSVEPVKREIELLPGRHDNAVRELPSVRNGGVAKAEQLQFCSYVKLFD